MVNGLGVSSYSCNQTLIKCIVSISDVVMFDHLKATI